VTLTRTTIVDSPIGKLRLAAEDGVLTGLYMDGARHGPIGDEAWVEDDSLFGTVVAQLEAYFAGELTTFDVPLRTSGTKFQEQVWGGLREIPYAATWSYGQLATRVGNPKASRAVGLANGRNPISIIVPCHRVIGANGSLTGYGGGLDRKAWLLEHEARHAANHRGG
jgi:methylated-DNA-[protein]-cysteine S-methyltransferase